MHACPTRTRIWRIEDDATLQVEIFENHTSCRERELGHTRSGSVVFGEVARVHQDWIVAIDVRRLLVSWRRKNPECAEELDGVVDGCHEGFVDSLTE